MAIRKIAQMGHPVLRQRAEEVPPEVIGSQRIQTLIDDMIETMRDAHGAGIAAPQVHEPLRISVIEVHESARYPDMPGIPLSVLVNPIVEAMVPVDPLADRDAIVMYEGCLSVDGIRGRVRRPRQVRVRALDREGRPIELVWEGLRSAVVQHETDHLDGILFIDRAEVKTLCFLPEYERYVRREERMIDGGARPE
ncbi:MAG: peptide deformylase [Polyangiaceae bacterium]|nr:peptide deformylase [Polyangiaceae bacterium]